MVNRKVLLNFIGPAILFTGVYATPTTVVVSSTTAHAIPTTLWGQTFEDVNAGDGGLYAEILKNRAFQLVTPNTPEALDGWQSINDGQLTVIADPVPVSSALPNSLRVTIPPDSFGLVGFGNTGYSGIKVNKLLTYTASFYYRFPTASSFQGNAIVGFQTASGLSLGSVTTPLSGAQTTWRQVTVTIQPAQNPFNNNNYFSILLDSDIAAGQTIHFAMLSVFPPTFNGRVNGLRPDIVTALREMTPGFLRFPGGKNLGTSVATRWQWNATVGKLVDRPGRVGTWGYVNTDGLGLYEFLQFCEDIGATPIMGVWAGFALDGTTIAQKDIRPYIQQAVDQINFAIGPTSTPQGQLRSSLGHPNPFPMPLIEIGNEDFFSSDTYVTRWRLFTTILSQNFPQLRYIATSNTNNPVLAPDPTHWDVHSFNTPSWFAQNSNYYDNFERNGTLYLEGEYAASFVDPANHDTLLYPTMQATLGEAAFMTGIERNSDIVFGASYAPLLNNIANTQLSPSLLSFDLNTVIRSTSFYSQVIFAANRGLVYNPSTLPDPNGTLFWSVTQDGFSFYVKVVNTGSSPEDFIFLFPKTVRFGTVTVLKGNSATDSNTPATPSLVAPVTVSTLLPGPTTQLPYASPPFSISAIFIHP